MVNLAVPHGEAMARQHHPLASVSVYELKYSCHECAQNGIEREFSQRDHLVRGSIVDANQAILQDRATGEDHIGEKALRLVGGFGSHQRRTTASNHVLWLTEWGQERAEAVTVIGVGGVVDRQPAFLGAQR